MADATMSNVLKRSGKEIHAAWSKDLASAAGGVHLWNLPTRREIARIGTERITRLAFSPDGNALLLSDANGKTRVLRAADLAEADRLPPVSKPSSP